MAMAMARVSSGPAYPERFYAAAAYAGFGGSSNSSTGAISKFRNDVALLLYALYQQATIGPCNIPKPRAWNPVENSKWTSWHGLGNMPSAEAMRLFVKILEEEDPAWYSKVPEFTVEPIVDVEMNELCSLQVQQGSRKNSIEEEKSFNLRFKGGNQLKPSKKPKMEPVTQSAIPNGNPFPEPKTISPENGSVLETQDKDVIMEGLGSVGIYDQWIAPSISGQRPKPRYVHGAAIVQDKMYVFGGNHNGRYLNDLQVLDLKSLTWSKIEAKAQTGSPESPTVLPVTPCAGHSLITWGNKILSIGGHTKDPSETITVKEFDPQTCMWSNLKTYGKPPISRGGQSVTLVGTTLVMFGGEDAKRSLLNDLHILDLETMTWDDIDAIDLHVLDLQTMEWSIPKQQGVTPGPRAGHAGVTVGENWFIVGGGNNVNGVSETLVLNMSALTWSVVTTVQGRMPLASEGLSLVLSTYNGEDFLVSFGGYNGRYSNEVYVLKPSPKADLQSKMIEGPVSDSTVALLPTTNASRDVEPEIEAAQDGKIREILMDNGDAEPVELQSVRGQLAAEQSRCFKLEVDVAELRQKLQTMETLQKEVELLQRQKAASEQAALSAKQKQGSAGVWGWLAGSPPEKSDS
ncbi:Acyl-CoA-binding domain-containing protein 6 [Cocos nucifera]|uniref:Acyl-CoA-binding domain-containing protein 6 n=1 Tax=Cocos nucifera TaxID=13894 RepID=A0A8K0HT69_COCNU|nr:Acyl-CoA-binding domain-containing protein 6 [Cocos nucifera]